LYDEEGADAAVLEPLVELLLMSRESSLSNVVLTFDDFKHLFDISSPTVELFLDQSFLKTHMSESITNMPWY
jgi:hypothetical protein